MIVKIELKTGSNHNDRVCKSDIQRNIDAINRYKDGKQTCSDDILLMDSISILEGIQKELPTR